VARVKAFESDAGLQELPPGYPGEARAEPIGITMQACAPWNNVPPVGRQRHSSLTYFIEGPRGSCYTMQVAALEWGPDERKRLAAALRDAADLVEQSQ
jgi:hypothetical protein